MYTSLQCPPTKRAYTPEDRVPHATAKYDTAQWEDTSFTSISDWTRTAGRSPPFAQMQNIDLSGLNHMGGTYFPWVIPEII